jgi:PAS domain S-box-containing protein
MSTSPELPAAPPGPLTPPIQRQFHLAAGTLAALVALAGAGVLVGWAYDSPTLKSLFAGVVTMKPNMALGLLLSGAGLWAYSRPRRAVWTDRVLRGLSGTAAAIGLITIIEWTLFGFLGWTIGIDQVLFSEDPNPIATGAPGRMAMSSAACLLFFNLAIILADATDRYVTPQILAATALTLAMIGAISDFFGGGVMLGLSAYTAMSVHGSWSVLLLGLGFFFARPAEGLMEVVSDDGPSGYVVRRLLPAVFVVPVVLALLARRGETAGWYDATYSMTLLVSSAVVALGLVVWTAGHLLRRLEAGRLAAERERRQSEERLRRAITGAPVPMVVHDDADTILDMSDGWTAFSGYTMQDTPTISDWIAVAQSSNKAEVEAHVSKMYRTKEAIHNREAAVTTKTGERRIWEFSTTPLGRLATGRQAYLTIAVDITKRRQAEAELHLLNDTLEQRIAERTEELTRANDALQRQSGQLKEQADLLDISSDAILVRDMAGTIVYWSAGATTMFGWGRDVALGANSHKLLGSAYSSPLTDIEQEAVAAGHWEGEVVQTTREGTPIAVEARWSLTRNERGEPQGFLEIHRDITERRLAEESLRESELRFRAVSETANEGIITVDDHGLIRYWNPGAAKMFGRPEQNALGQPLSIILPERWHRDLAGFRQLLDTSTAETSSDAAEVAGLRMDGSEFPMDVSVSSWQTSKGRFVSGILRDITDRKTAELALQAKHDELARSNEELEQFAYVASHDLQEPLRMVSNYTQLLGRRYKDQLDEAGNEFIEFAVDGAKRMQALIHDLLEFARVGTRGKAFKPTPIDRVVSDALANLTGAIEDTGAEVIVDDLPTLSVDRSQFTQVFQNLIGNAIKFRKAEQPPAVRVSARRNGTGWILAVKDNGIGIEPKYFDRIFQMFQRLHGREEYAGTGIGLALCKKIVERHGGRIDIESVAGTGTTFSLTMPETPPQGVVRSDPS